MGLRPPGLDDRAAQAPATTGSAADRQLSSATPEWHALGLPEVLTLLATDPEAGLTPAEARRRLSRLGPNRVGAHRETPLWRLILAQFRSLVVLLLLAAAIIAVVLGERVEALAILAALLLNAGIGFLTEWRARTSLAKLSEILAIFAGIVMGFPSPLLPLQILWVNLVTDILPAMALIRDPAEPDVMRRPPRDPRDALVTWRYGRRMLAEGALLSAGVLGAYFWTVWQAGPGPRATTIAFVALVLLHPFQAIHCRSDRLGWWRLPPNGLAWTALVVLGGVQWLAVSWTPLARLLGTVSLPASDWGMVTLWVLSPVLVLEALKATRARVSPR